MMSVQGKGEVDEESSELFYTDGPCLYAWRNGKKEFIIETSQTFHF